MLQRLLVILFRGSADIGTGIVGADTASRWDGRYRPRAGGRCGCTSTGGIDLHGRRANRAVVLLDIVVLLLLAHLVEVPRELNEQLGQDSPPASTVSSSSAPTDAGRHGTAPAAISEGTSHPAPGAADGVDLVEEQHAAPAVAPRRLHPGRVEQLADAPLGLADELGQDVGGADGEEGTGALSCHCAGQETFAGARWAMQQNRRRGGPDASEDGIGQVGGEGQGEQGLIEAELRLPVADDVGEGGAGNLGLGGGGRILLVGILAALLLMLLLGNKGGSFAEAAGGRRRRIAHTRELMLLPLLLLYAIACVAMSIAFVHRHGGHPIH